MAAPVFSRPFRGEFRVLNVFDHDLPIGYADDNRRAVDWRGRRFRATQAQDGHRGYDFEMPVGTPILAAADGIIAVAEEEEPRDCPLLGRTTSALWVKIMHVVPSLDGERIISNYVHLSRIDVRAGQQVRRGEVVGLSGNTGCSTVPHLHFAVARQRHTSDGRSGGVYFDPSGWRGRRPDPWRLHPDGALSTRLWRDGEAPRGL